MTTEGLTDIIYGRHAAQTGLETCRDNIEKIWIQKGIHLSDRIMRELKTARKLGAVLQYVDKKALDRLTRGAAHQGIALRKAAVVPVDPGEWLRTHGSEESSLVLALDGVQDPGNIGAIFRSAAAAGVNGVMIPKHGSAPLGATAMKTSAGTLQSIPIIRVTNLRNALDQFRKNGFFIIGVSEKATSSIVGMDVPLKTVVLAGSEDRGIRPIHQSVCDAMVHIPMRGPAGSLNVSVAVAIVLYEIIRRS
ncbi:MAG TPA: 23S rRNA (guanosine(2251)-2'-O)-methyltransferase RlmB [bacterium]|nr:23S rRNA (guanosine(2251)-2'-O)-methyltransferase RlmB [bacterium]